MTLQKCLVFLHVIKYEAKNKKNYQAAIRIWQKSENGEAGTITKVCGQTSRLTKMDVKMYLYLIYIYPRSLELELMSHQDCLCSIRKINKKHRSHFLESCGCERLYDRSSE